MARLSSADRAGLPDTAFAYVDGRGNRRLPINDASHVRNALARFNQVRFESPAAREAARTRLLKAARREGIVPIGFIDAELRSAGSRNRAGQLVIELSRVETSEHLQAELHRTLDDPDLTLLRWSKPSGTYLDCRGRPFPLPGPDDPRQVTFLQGSGRPLMAIVHRPDTLATPEISEAVLAAVHLVTGRELLDEVDDMGVATEGLPDGLVAFLLTDIEGSTGLLRSLGDRYPAVLADVRGIIRAAVLEAGGRQVEARADEFVAVFEGPHQALAAAIRTQQQMADHHWPLGQQLRVRAGVHAGDILLTDAGYVGITVHTAARIMAAAHGGQILCSGDTLEALGSGGRVVTTSIGTHRLRGLASTHELFQVEAPGVPSSFPPPRV